MNERKEIYFRNKNVSVQFSFHVEDKEPFQWSGQNDSSTYLGCLEIRSLTYFHEEELYLSG